MRAPSRFAGPALALFSAVLLISGCATAPDTSEPAVTDPTVPTTPTDELEVDAAWLDDGRMVALVTWGSSSCVPVAEQATASGQTVSVTLDAGPPDRACTADFAARATLVALPAGVDPTQDVELQVTLGEASGDTDLEGNPALTGVPGEETNYAPSAGWYDDSSLVLLTWGSSTCLPVVESVEVSEQANAATVNFASSDDPCTMDMVARATLLELGVDDDDADDDFMLTLVGGGLDATLSVVEG